MTGALFSKENLNVLESIAAKKETLKLITEDWKAEISEIDQEIDKLKNQRNLYLAKATRLQNQGDRLQFENNNLIDARRAWQQAQIHREIATRIQEEIDTLEKRKNQILEAHGITGGEKRESSN
jgi:FtsZ-binding cell division protein ZapB